jgi:outer membrane protein OmpA-like peptidoglycan-associated protein/opacity protein-like surface antigen
MTGMGALMAAMRRFVAIALLMGAAGTAAAEDDEAPPPGPGLMEAGVFAGLYISNYYHQFYNAKELPGREELGDSPSIGARYAYFPKPKFGVEVEGGAILASTKKSGELATIYNLHAHVIGQLPGRITPFAALGIGLMHIRSKDDVVGTDTDFPLHFTLGARYYVTNAIALRLDGRYLRGPASREPYTLMAGYAEILLGVSFVPDLERDLPPDPDGDGVRGAADACPNEAGPRPTGCPPRDRDKDGLLEPQDQCPDQPETVNGVDDTDGCPDTVKDTDGDGIDDKIDKCKDEPEDKDAFEDEDGCPEVDNDKDGLLDAADKCPEAAGPPENTGCPDTDGDGDGVVDRLDNCPTEPGTKEFHGCKTKQLVVITTHQLQVMENVLFDLGKATLKPRSKKLLDEMARILIAHPEIEKIKVEGHTDAKGSDARNKILSQARAESVVAYLVKVGVDLGRLEAIGHGEESPLEDNATSAGRRANRRVEFNIVKE